MAARRSRHAEASTRTPNDDDRRRDARARRAAARVRAARARSWRRCDRRDGCPWDREQTHATLRPSCSKRPTRRSTRSTAAISTALAGELGDVLFQCVFHAQIAAEAGRFDIADAVDAHHRQADPPASARLHADGRPLDARRRGARAASARRRPCMEQWEQIKAREQADAGATQRVLAGVPRVAAGAASRARDRPRASRRSASTGRDAADVIDKIDEEVRELREALSREPGARGRGARRPAVLARQPRAQARHRARVGAARGQRQVHAPLRRGRGAASSDAADRCTTRRWRAGSCVGGREGTRLKGSRLTGQARRPHDRPMRPRVTGSGTRLSPRRVREVARSRAAVGLDDDRRRRGRSGRSRRPAALEPRDDVGRRMAEQVASAGADERDLRTERVDEIAPSVDVRLPWCADLQHAQRRVVAPPIEGRALELAPGVAGEQQFDVAVAQAAGRASRRCAPAAAPSPAAADAAPRRRPADLDPTRPH